MEVNKIYCIDALEGLKTLPDESVNCCVTSPPYWGLRDYGVDGQLGLELTPEEFVNRLVEILGEARRVLRDDGTLWLNLGDCYAGSGFGWFNTENSYLQSTNHGTILEREKLREVKKSQKHNCKPKDLIGIPWMVAFALRDSGWYLRQDIIWSKPNPMPESVTDRCTKSHEYIFLLSKSKKYYYNAKAISEKTVTKDNIIRDRDNTRLNNPPGRRKMGGLKTNNYETRNKRSVWSVNNKSYRAAHFATFPVELITDCIKAGCPEDGIVLDPFMGAGTTAVVARKLNRNYIGIELNPDYVKIAEKRLEKELGMFK